MIKQDISVKTMFVSEHIYSFLWKIFKYLNFEINRKAQMFCLTIRKKMATHLYISFVITMIGFCSLFDGVVFFLKSKLMPCACHYKGKLMSYACHYKGKLMPYACHYKDKLMSCISL